MARRVHDLTLSNLDALPDACRACAFWEVAGAPRGPQRELHAGEEAKEAWLQATQLEWGAPGKVLYLGGRPAGYGLFAPPGHFPRTRRIGGSASDDALLLAALWINPEQRGAGLAKVLLHALLRETHRRGSRALEAYGSRLAVPPATCVLPETFLLRNGFSLLHDHAEWPLLRLDLRQTARWQSSVGQALEQVVSALTARERARAPVRGTSAVHQNS